MSFYKNKQNHKIAYKSLKGRGLGIIFIHGLNSDMNGAKAITVEKYARKNNLNFIRFDCRGHGKSEGKFEEFTISDWRKDLLDIIDNIAKGPQILIGSSMGGWLMMLAAKARPQRIKGMIGLAAAPDFGKDLYNILNKKNKKEINTKGITKYTSYGFSYYLTKNFFIEAEKNRVLIITNIECLIVNFTNWGNFNRRASKKYLISIFYFIRIYFSFNNIYILGFS